MKRKKMAAAIMILSVMSIVVLLLMGKSDAVGTDGRSDGNHETSGDGDTSGKDRQQVKNSKKEKIDYSKMGNNQGNLEVGGEQVFVYDNRILMNIITEDNSSRMVYFNTDTAELELACDRENCLHNEAGCMSNQTLSNLQSYSSVVFGSPWATSRRELWKYENADISCFYKSNDDIGAMRVYAGYLYYTTDFGLIRVSMDGNQDKQKEEQVLDRPVFDQELIFYKDKMYFCQDDFMLYSANLDGSKKTRLVDEKLYFPQIYDDRIYYRSIEYDENGVWEMENTLYSVSLEGKDRQKVLEEVYQFNVLDNGVYYVKIPDDGETTLCFLDFATGEQREITDCQSGYLYVFEETDWIVFEKTEGELKEGEIAAKPSHLYCIKKDGSGEKRLDYPQALQK